MKYNSFIRALKSIASALLVLVTLSLIYSCQSDVQPENIEPRRIEVLFLGHDSDHHNSEEFLPYLAASLTPKGINFTYTSDLDDLNTAYLKHFDAIAIYANHDEIGKEQEQALVKYVKSGGGLVPIHSASYCFRNSPEYVKMVGGQFSSHDTATFSQTIINTEHPISAGYTPFSSWDETYVHTAHSDKEVLMERVEGDHHEPYTWVKNYGKGRVFYTALGHDLRTWDQPGFHELIYRGITWAIGDQKKSALEQLTFPTLAYTPAKIANYEKRDPAPQLQAPLSPEESMKLIQLPPEFDLKLFASEPDIVNPIAMAWDERGRLWIAETIDYPNEIKPEPGIGRDRIKILEDTDDDGKADKFTVFAENLSVPTSIVFSNGGIIVAQAPHFIFLKDNDGDDVADERKIIMEGWGTSDTHAGPSNLRYGFDNRIWGVVGYSAFDGEVGGEKHNINQGLYSFTPDGSDMDHISRTSNNTWGLGFTEANDVFISTANNTHSGYYGIPHDHLDGVDGIYLRGVAKIDGHYLFHPITRNYRQVDVFGGFTAAAGHTFYTARDYPKEYWNSTAFVAEPTGHLLHRAELSPKGAGYEEKDGWNLLAASDEWFSPVAADVGPDGAVWVLDWYNFIIQHNPTPPGFENGFGNAHINPLRDKQRGRIYRVVHKEAKGGGITSLDPNNTEELLSALHDDNMLWRMHAHRLLVENADQSIKGQLIANVKDQSIDEMGLNNAALHSLWVLHGLDLMDDSEVLAVAKEALSHPADAVRKGAIQVLPNDESTLAMIQKSRVLKDKNGRTRLAAINKLWKLPSTDALAETILSLANENSVLSDLWLARATYLAAVKHEDLFLKAVLKDNPNALSADKDNSIILPDFTSPTLDISKWGEIEIPQWLGNTGIEALSGFKGVMWYGHEVDLTSAQISDIRSLHLPGASNKDNTYINGQKIGGGQGWNNKRNYKIPHGLLKEGKNIITIQVEAGGGIGGDKDLLYFMGKNNNIPLAGYWKYHIEKVVLSGRSEYADGDNIIDLFLKHYGPESGAVAPVKEEVEVDKKFTVKTIKDQMKYDVTTLNVNPGDLIEITFENNDAMLHNLLVLAPDQLEKVGIAAEQMAKEMDAAERDYTPDVEGILGKIPMVNPGESFKLIVQMPNKTGNYPYVCTFPGHWQTMNGVIRVRE